MKKAPIQITVTSKQIADNIMQQKQKGVEISYRATALSLMPKGVKWFESGEDWGFALWLERVMLAAIHRGKHVKGTYTFQTGKAKF